MKVAHDPAELVQALDAARERGLHVGVVPTMGALHAGHLALVDGVRAKGATFVVVTIFVNPLQFNDPKDLAAYPRTLETDLAACDARGVDLVFAPARQAMYPEGFQSEVSVQRLTRRWEGEFRPGHFAGVTTVVAKLFALTAPCSAMFGLKDYQQWKVLERMARDLGLRVQMHAHEIVREPDGLAMSSRNARLSPQDRARALALHRGLTAARRAFDGGERDAAALTSRAEAEIRPVVDRIDYVACVDPETLEPLGGAVERAILLVAAHLGAVRLIDNAQL